MRPFIAFICKLPDNTFCALFPDLPGCTAKGNTIAHVLVDAQDALAQHCAELRETGTPVPWPSLIQDLGPNQPDGLLALIKPPDDAWPERSFLRSA